MQSNSAWPRYRLLGAVLFLVFVVIGVWFWAETHRVSTTDDAFVDCDIITVVSGAQGRVLSLSVEDNAHIQRGAPILTIDAEDLKLTLDGAVAAKDLADAQFNEVKAAGGAASDRGKAADASVRQAAIRVAQAQLALDRAQVTAPVSGYVAHRMVGEGDSVRQGQPLLSIVGDHSWIIANLKETQLDGVKTGDSADIRVDAFPALRLKGHVESVQQGAGQSFSLLPPENASGNFVKVVQRVPVKVALDTKLEQPLAPGLSARVTIHVR